VLNEEVRRKSQGSPSQADILVPEDRERDRTKVSRNRGKSRSKSRSKYNNITCNHCGKKGHIKRFCRKLNQDTREGKKAENNENNVAAIVRDVFLFAYDENIINLVSHETSWIVDSEATSHVMPIKDFFSSYTPVDFGVLKMGNASEIKVF